MQERLRTRDLAFLATESPSTPMHNATLEIFDPKDSGFDCHALSALIADRIAFVPRYRQLLQFVPGRLANPLWVDDPAFDLEFHVRRAALPQPGDEAELRELVARIVARPLDRNRPLWEVYFIEGLENGQVAVLSKSHQILVDGVETVDIGQVLLDVSPEPKLQFSDDWVPRSRPTGPGLVAGAVADTVLHPSVAAATARSTAASLRRTTQGYRDAVRGIAGAMAGRRPARPSPVSAALSEQRRFVTVRTCLDDYRKVRRHHGGTVNDVILATVTGALRAYFSSRNEGLGDRRSLRAMVPMSVIDDELEATSLGTQIAGHLVDLPIAEQSPVIRLHQVSYAFKAHRETGRAVAANRLAGIAGFAPTTFHALGSRVAAEQVRKGFQLSVTNVPGPQFPLYAAGAQMKATYPVHPLLPGHAMVIGVTSYDGGVHYGITADRDALPDIEIFGQCLVEALDELVEASSSSRHRIPRGRKKGNQV
jgi:diacylglycerol O-acyltransferase